MDIDYQAVKQVWEQPSKGLRPLWEEVIMPKKTIETITSKDGSDIVGFQFVTYNPFYKSVPLCSVVGIEVALDGLNTSFEKISLNVRGQKIPLSVTTTIEDIWWHFSEGIIIEIEHTGGLEASQYQLELAILIKAHPAYGMPLNIYRASVVHEVSVV